MGLRIHLTEDDLKRVTLAQGPAPLWETVMSLRAPLRPGRGDPPSDRQRWANGRARHATRLVRSLVPPVGYLPDLLTPPETGLQLEAGIDAVLSTPRRRVREELGLLLADARNHPPSPLTRALAEGGARALAELGDVLRAYHGAVIAPLDRHVRAAFEQAVAPSVGRLLTGGLEALLGNLHERIHWRDPVLELDRPGQDDDVHLDGRGVHLLPSHFCPEVPTVYADTTLPCTIVFAMGHGTAWRPPDPGTRPDRDSLAPLLGATRALVLRSIAAEHRGGTTDLAGRLGISPATVSHHVAALRSAGLVRTERTGVGVSHLPTPLGRRLTLA